MAVLQDNLGWRIPYSGGGPIRKPSDIYAVEVYYPPDIPPEYSHRYWVKSRDGKFTYPCVLVVMWSMREAQKGLRRMAAPKM